MKKVLALGALLLAGTFVMSLAASAATVLAAKNGMTVSSRQGCQRHADVLRRLPQDMATVSCQERRKDGRRLTTVKRKDGSLQWTYDGKPLYFYSADKTKGDKAGDGIGGVWHIVSE